MRHSTLLFISILLLFLTYQPTTVVANNNNGNSYDASILYLTAFNKLPVKVSLNNKDVSELKSLAVVDGVQPGKYLIKITQPIQYVNASTKKTTAKEKHDKILFYGHIIIPPRKVIYAFIDKDSNFKIVKQRPTVTVYNPTFEQPSVEGYVQHVPNLINHNHCERFGIVPKRQQFADA